MMGSPGVLVPLEDATVETALDGLVVPLSGTSGLGPQPVFPSLEANVYLADVEDELEDLVTELGW